MDDMSEILEEFLAESAENLDQIDLDLIELEKNPHDRDKLAQLFRVIHTIKGTCGFIGLHKLESLAHAGENLLSKLRDGAFVLTPEMTTVLLAMVDAIRVIINSLAATGQEGPHNFDVITQRLKDLNNGDEVAHAAQPAASSEGAQHKPQERQSIDSAGTRPDHERRPAPSPEVTSAPSPAVGASAQDVSNQAVTGSRPETSIRVDVELLDQLMNLVGELVLARNQILQHSSGTESASLQATMQRLNHVTTELQEGVMKTRMQPIGHIWSKLPRVVRDLAMSCGKQVRIEMEGEQTELDKTLIEAIKDPLTHLVRNAIDHGIEDPDKRLAWGKSAQGCLSLRAYHESGQVNIEISDDGAGLDLERIKAKALERNLVTPNELARMSEREIMSLVFLPGFSTAAQVTHVSGRGVGMDVVKTNIEKIGGAIDIQSQPGEGTTFKLKVPLTLAIIPALTIRCAGDRYAIPQVNLLELIRLEGQQRVQGIETLHGAMVYRLRGQLLPLVDLRDLLNLPPRSSDVEAIYVVVLQADDQEFGLIVDMVDDTEEIVVKPMSKAIKAIECFAGATIMGDGRVALILDAMGLAIGSNVLHDARNLHALLEADDDGVPEAERQQFLLFGGQGKSRMAMPLAKVARLEEFPSDRIEHAGHHKVVQYRDAILPLVSLSDVFGGGDTLSEGTLNVVVTGDGDNAVGLVVGQILDIVEERISVQTRSARPGVATTAVVQGKVTEIIDVQTILAMNPLAA